MVQQWYRGKIFERPWIGTIIRSLGQNPTDHEIHKYWKEMGSKEGIDSSTFIAIMMQILGNKESSFNETSEEVLDAFRVFDKNGEGFISGTNSKVGDGCWRRNVLETTSVMVLAVFVTNIL